MTSRSEAAIATLVTVLLLMAISTGSTYFIFWEACGATVHEPIGPEPQ